MANIDFTQLDDWKAFERLTSDLLEAEGFRIVSEPSVDRSGVDILAEEVLASHSGATQIVRWFVQCKHYAESGKSIGRKEVEEILYCFNPRPEGGLLIVIDTDVGEEADRVIKNYSQGKGQDRLIKVWNRRELENRLVRHPILLKKYRLGKRESPVRITAFEGADLRSKKILIVSDSSAFSYQLFSLLNDFCETVHLITVWQYQSAGRSQLLFDDLLELKHDLVILFLGDSFAFPLPDGLRQKLIRTAKSGGSLLMFPFLAWALAQGFYPELESIVPVRLAAEPRRDQLWLKSSRIISSGDLSALNDESFIENQYVTVAATGRHSILTGLPKDFGFIHSFEFVELKEDASPVLSDTMGNPILVY